MKKSLATLFVFCMLFVSAAFAEETTRGNYVTPNEHLTEWLNTNEYISHTHGYDTPDPRKNQVGLGVDLVVWENQKEHQVMQAVEIQEKYDINNNENAVYAVAKVNVFNLFKKITKKEEATITQ